MIESFLGGVPSQRVNIEQVRQQIFGRRTKVLGPPWVPELEPGLDQFVG